MKNWIRNEFDTISEMLDFVNRNNLKSDDFKVFTFKGFIQLIYNKGAFTK